MMRKNVPGGSQGEGPEEDRDYSERNAYKLVHVKRLP